MKTPLPTTLMDAKAMLGGSSKTAAQALGYVSTQSFDKIHEPLDYRMTLAVIGAWYLQQQAQADQAPAPRPARPAKRTRWLFRRAA